MKTPKVVPPTSLQAAAHWLSSILSAEAAQPEITPEICELAAQRIVTGRSLTKRRNLPPETVRSALSIVFEFSAVLDQATLSQREAEILHAQS